MMHISLRTALCTVMILLSGAVTSAFAQVTLLRETFSRAVAGTLDDVSYAGTIDDITDNKGWTADGFAQAEGMFVFSPTIAPVTLTSPIISCESDGEVTVAMTLAVYYNERYFTGDEATVELCAPDGMLLAKETFTVDKPRFADYILTFPAQASSTPLRVALSFANGGNRHKLFLDDITVSQAGDDGGVGEIAADRSDAWVSGPNELSVRAAHAAVYTPDGRCIYSGGPATIHVEARIVIVDIDGKVKKLRIN